MKTAVSALVVLCLFASGIAAQAPAASAPATPAPEGRPGVVETKPGRTGNFTFEDRGPVIGNLYRLGLQNNPANIPVFVAALKDPDFRVREAAMAQLVFTHDDSALLPVIASMQDPSRLVRRCAIAVLERIGSPRAVPALTEALSYFPPEYREHKNRRTGQIVHVFENLRPEEYFNRLAAALALHRLGSDAGHATVLECLRNPASKAVETMALQCVLEMKLTEAVPDCIRIARDWTYFGEDSGGLFALRALYALGDDAHRTEIVALALQKNDSLGLNAPIWTLALLVRFGDSDLADVFKQTLRKAQNHEHIYQCILGLQKYKPDGAASLIAQYALTPQDVDPKTGRVNWEREYKIFQMGCLAIADLQDKSVVPALRSLRESYAKPDDWFFYRLWLDWTLARLDDASARDSLRKSLGHNDPAVRRLAANLLVRLDDKDSAPLLVASLKRETEPYTFQILKKSVASFGPLAPDVAALPAPPEPPVPADTYGKPRFVQFAFDDCATVEAMERITGLMEDLASHNVRWAATLYYAPLSRFDHEYDRVLVQRCFDRGAEIECHTLYHNPNGRQVDASNDEELRGNVVGCNVWLKTYILGLKNIYKWKGGGGGFARPGDPVRTWRDIAEILPEAGFALNLPSWWDQPTISSFDLLAPPFHLDPVHDRWASFEPSGQPRLVSLRSAGDLRYSWDADDPDERIRGFVATFDYWYFNQPDRVFVVGGHDWPNAPLPDRPGNDLHWKILGDSIRRVLLDNRDRFPLARSMTDLELVYVFKKMIDPEALIARKVHLQTNPD